MSPQDLINVPRARKGLMEEAGSLREHTANLQGIQDLSYRLVRMLDLLEPLAIPEDLDRKPAATLLQSILK